MEGKMEKILVTSLKVQSLMNTKENNDDIDLAITEIRSEIVSKSDHVLSLQITEVVERLEKSSETLQKDLKEMNNSIERLQATID
jgi:prefoldin subunit 5